MNLTYNNEFTNQLEKGAFLTVKTKQQLNTMTIGWGMTGIMWSKPMVIVPVRFSRHTYKMLQEVDEFTISVPLNGDLNKALAFAGTKSGRDIDKFKALGLTAVPGKKISTPIIGECQLHYECRIVHIQTLEPSLLDPSIKESKYADHDYHVMFYGEILAEYKL
jgi:flavin reductase (DIM6/NTAB) family NADH-FMN oxidoreductase RutF